MQREINLPYSKSWQLIENADVLLFRHPHSIFSPGFWVSKYTLNQHSHVGLAFKKSTGISVIEFKEFIGGRVYPLEKYLDKGYIIDIYRVIQNAKLPYLDTPPIINGHRPVIVFEEIEFSEEIAQKILNEAKDLVSCGIRYGWLNILWIFLRHLPIINIFLGKNIVDKKPKRWVCSTLVSYLYRKYYIDLVNDINDSFITPGDISTSSILNYLFTISEI